MRIVSWNINSVRLRQEMLKRIADELQPDFLCLQEIKAQQSDFPADAIAEIGFPHQHVRGMKGYNGVAILARTPLADGGSRDWCAREDCRHVAADVGGEWSCITSTCRPAATCPILKPTTSSRTSSTF